MTIFKKWVFLKRSIYYIKLYYIKILIYYDILKMSTIFTEIFLPVLILGINDCKLNLIILKYLYLYHMWNCLFKVEYDWKWWSNALYRFIVLFFNFASIFVFTIYMAKFHFIS